MFVRNDVAGWSYSIHMFISFFLLLFSIPVLSVENACFIYDCKMHNVEISAVNM
jgi:hypothetical protein